MSREMREGAAAPLRGEGNGFESVLAAYATVLETMPIAAWIVATDGYVRYCSPAWEQFTGLSAAEMSEFGYTNYVHEDDVVAVVEAWNAAVLARRAYRGELRMRFGDGLFRWVHCQTNPIFDAEGELAGYLGTLADVHERRLIEDALTRTNEELEESRERYRLITESIPGTIWTALPDGQLDYIADGRYASLRRPATTRLADDWLDGVHPEDREGVAERWRRSLATGELYEATLRSLMTDGAYRWHLARALPQRDADGAIVRWIGMSIDIDDRVRADEDREKFEKLADTSSDIIGITDENGIIVYANPAALALVEAALDELLGRHFVVCFLPEDVSYVGEVIFPELQRGGQWSGDLRLRNFRTGAAIPVSYNAFAIEDRRGAISGYAVIGRDMRDRERFDIGMRALAEAGKAMHESLDLETTVQNIADAMVDGFANNCSVEVAEADGRIGTMTIGARSPEAAVLARKAAAVRNRNVPPDHPIRRAMTRGESTLIQIVQPDFLKSTGVDAHVGRDSGKLDLRSLIYVPVRSPQSGRIYASLSCGLAAGDPRGAYTEEDVKIAEQIAIRAGIAFDNAHAYERTRRIAAEMQKAALPVALPQSRALQLHAEYRPATDESTIGGDWYDGFALPDGRIAVTIGDVVGHGLHAAIRMMKMRQSMQAAAMLDPDPRVMLAVANRTLHMLEGDLYATALAAVFDDTTRTLTIASAGHPSPVIVRAAGHVEETVCRGLLLGAESDLPAALCEFALEPGDLVVFFTDGLVEFDRDYERGMERLRRALASDAVRAAANPALALFERVLEGAPILDDVAILTLRVTD